MKIRVSVLEDGPGPLEKIVQIKTHPTGTEMLIVSARTVVGSFIDVGGAILYESGRVLIELPRESTSGRWRIWVPTTEVQRELQPAE